LLAPWIAAHNPFDLASVNLLDAVTPPAWTAQGNAAYLLGTDNQGRRDVLSAILYGARISLAVGVAAVLFSMVLGVSLGLLSGYLGGPVDALLMRMADVQLSFPATLIADQQRRPAGVTDGDTITMLHDNRFQHRIRLAGIDSPEKAQPFGQRSKQHLADLAIGKDAKG
jgi:hypothetical protein